jgi:hypothetical protein
MCNRDCNQGRRCPARLYPGIGKCSDLDNLAQKTVQDEQRGEEQGRRFAVILALWIARALFVVIVLLAALGYSCFLRLL